jgi:hypothetical protein
MRSRTRLTRTRLRRQAHETAIHRADAERAAAATPVYPAEFAADGIDELITSFGARRKYQPPPPHQVSSSADGGLLRVVAADTGDAWSIETRQGRLQPHRETRPSAARAAACTCGTAPAPLRRTSPSPGNPMPLTSWQASVKVRWG